MPLLEFAGELTHHFAIIRWIAAALAFLAAWRQPGEGMAALDLAVVAVIVVNGVFSYWQAYRAERAPAAEVALIALIALIDHTPWGNAVFGTAPIGADVWGFILPFAAAMVAVEEARKWIARNADRFHPQ